MSTLRYSTIVVIGGMGQAFMQMAGNGDAFSLISPDDTPDYQLEIYDPDGFVVLPSVQVMTQFCKADVPFAVRGIYLIKIHDAIDDGVYKVKPFFRAKSI